MDVTLFPTKGNLILARNTLRLSQNGYELLDKKRNILIREMMELIDRAKELQKTIDSTFAEAYRALRNANILMGINAVSLIAQAVPVEESVHIRFRSVMGVELPIVTADPSDARPPYGFTQTNPSLDEAYSKFRKVKELTLTLAEVETSVYRLASNISKTQKRANALKNVMIPRYEGIVRNIQDVLDEKEREDFTRLKVIKRQKSEKNEKSEKSEKNETAGRNE